MFELFTFDNTQFCPLPCNDPTHSPHPKQVAFSFEECCDGREDKTGSQDEEEAADWPFRQAMTCCIYGPPLNWQLEYHLVWFKPQKPSFREMIN